MEASGDHPNNFCGENSVFLVVEVTYNHSLYNRVLHIWSKNPSKIKFFGSETILKCPDRLYIAQERTASVCYELGASQDHPGSFTHKKKDFVIVEVTYNHSLYNGILHIWSKNPSKIKVFGSETTLKCPDRLDIAQERTTGACYELRASQDHLGSFTHKK